MADTTDTTAASSGSSFLSGVGDFFGSVLQKAPAVINAINAPKVAASNASASASTFAATVDTYGRHPGEAGYGTATPPVGITAGGMPAWVKPVAIGAAVLVALFVILKMVRK